MFNKIISINTHQSNFLEAITVVAKLILSIEGSDDIDLIIDAIKAHDFKHEFFFCDEEGMPLTIDSPWNNLAAVASNDKDKKILESYSNTSYDHKKEKTVSEWIIFILMQGQYTLYKNIKSLVDAGKIDKAKQILRLHKEAVELSIKIEQYFCSKKQTEFTKKDLDLFNISHGLLGYLSSVKDLQKVITDAEDFLKKHL